MVLTLLVAVYLATPALAQPNGLGPKYDKYVASLLLTTGDEGEGEVGVRYGQVIFNTNPEDDGTYELEVEVEECLDLAGNTLDVYLDDVWVGTIDIDESGNGKATFYVEGISTSDHVDVVGAVTLTTKAEWRLWVKAPGPK